MANKADILTKRMAITNANVQMVAVVAVASFVTVFCLVAARAIWSQNSYQSRLTSAKEKAHTQLQKNIQAYSSLTSSYETFVSTPNNVIGGPTTGTGVNGGNNAKIILDALPPSYDFPALTSSIQSILTSHGFTISDISGTDDQLNQQGNTSNPNPKPVSMPFSFTVSNTNYLAIGQLITVLQQSIRPIQVDTLEVSGAQDNMSLTVTAHTYYQPAKNLRITTEVVK